MSVISVMFGRKYASDKGKRSAGNITLRNASVMFPVSVLTEHNRHNEHNTYLPRRQSSMALTEHNRHNTHNTYIPRRLSGMNREVATPTTERNSK